MKKLRLRLDNLRVDSFATSATHGGSGTIRGLAYDQAVIPGGALTYPECPSPLCMDTELASCNGSCRPGCVANPETGAGVGAGVVAPAQDAPLPVAG